MLAGYSCVGMSHAGFLDKWGGERGKENSGKQRFKIFFFPASACAGKKENSAKTTLFRVVFFFCFVFEENENKFRSDPKMDYDSCPPLYNAYEAKKLLDGLHSKLVKKKTKMVYFPGRLAHTLTLFRGDQPTHSQWSIFRGDLPTHAHSGLFSWATCPHKLTLVYFHGRPAHTHSH